MNGLKIFPRKNPILCLRTVGPKKHHFIHSSFIHFTFFHSQLTLGSRTSYLAADDNKILKRSPYVFSFGSLPYVYEMLF